jgi:hypothetical protein
MASLNNGWLARGGHLRLHDDHLSFVPTPIERLLLARRVRIDFDQITGVERHPAQAEDFNPGGRAPRMRVRAAEGSFDFVFHSGLDDWIEAVDERRSIWETRQRMADS